MVFQSGLLRELLNHDVIFAMIEQVIKYEGEALDLQPDESSKNKDTPKVKPQTSLNEMPPHKSPGVFISHKKVTAQQLKDSCLISISGN